MTTCKECKFYQPHQAGEAKAPYGYCFLKPPVVVMMLQEIPPLKVDTRFAARAAQQPNAQLLPAAVRPQVREHEFCGEWQVMPGRLH